MLLGWMWGVVVWWLRRLELHPHFRHGRLLLMLLPPLLYGH